MDFGKGFENSAERESNTEGEKKQQDQESEDQLDVPYVFKCAEEGLTAVGVKLGESAFEKKKEKLEEIKNSFKKMKIDFESGKQMIEVKIEEDMKENTFASIINRESLKHELLVIDSVVGETELLIEEIEENKNALKFYKLEEKMRYLKMTINYILKITEELEEYEKVE